MTPPAGERGAPRGTIRPAGDDDAEALLLLGDRPNRSLLEEMLTQVGLAAEGGISLVYELDGEVAGNVVVRPMHDGDVLRVAELGVAVADVNRGRGIGRQLLHVAVDWAREEGFDVVQLRTEPGNEAALRLYTGAGFVLDGDSIDVGADAVVMRLHLSDG